VRPRSLARSLDRSIERSLARSIARSLDRSTEEGADASHAENTPATPPGMQTSSSCLTEAQAPSAAWGRSIVVSTARPGVSDDRRLSSK